MVGALFSPIWQIFPVWFHCTMFRRLCCFRSTTVLENCHSDTLHTVFHCPVGFWVMEQLAIILSATVRSPTVNQTWISMICAVAAKTLLCQIFHKWRRIEVNCVLISRSNWYPASGTLACLPNRRYCAGQLDCFTPNGTINEFWSSSRID